MSKSIDTRYSNLFASNPLRTSAGWFFEIYTNNYLRTENRFEADCHESDYARQISHD